MSERHKRFEAIFNGMHLAILVVDPQSEIITDANPAAQDLLARPTAALVGQKIAEIPLEDSLKLRQLMQKASRQGDACSETLHCLGADGKVLPVEIYAALLERPRRRLIMLTLRDVSATKEAQMKLMQARDAAEFSNRAKSQFLANMSHELRTPLNAINGFARIMADGLFGPLENEKYEEYMQDIIDSGAHLLSIINDILDISKVEAGQMDLREEKTSLPEVVQAAVALVGNRAKQSELTLSTALDEALPSLWADPRALKQIALNLLSNAIKFTPRGGEIECGARLEADGSMLLYVADTGVGIPEKDYQTIFEPFSQLDHDLAAEAEEGTGLGLALCKQLAGLHGAEIGVISEVGKGTAVSVKFPPERTISGRSKGGEGPAA
ncbi:MAG: PAS domain S-box protein [Proteobacteria bacterium]|nr:PAS domain S-box protein [Pseudomonadota bacterium]